MSKYQDRPRRFFHATYRSQNDWGHCCEIVPYLDYENPNTTNMDGNDYTDQMWNEIPEGNARSGVRNGLRLLIDVESFEYASSDIGASGVKVAPIDKDSTAIMSQHGVYANEGTETLFTLDATKFNTNPRTYSIEPIKRTCYLDREFDLKYTPYDLGFVYTLDNCQINAYVDVVVKNCSCLPPMIFADHNETVLNAVPWMRYKVSTKNDWQIKSLDFYPRSSNPCIFFNPWISIVLQF